MQSFIQFLNEGRTTRTDFDTVFKFAQTRCLNYMKQSVSQSVYRGISRSNGPMLFGDSTGTKRTSAFATDNYYNLMFSNLESWKNFPPREESFICSNEQEIASAYGKVYRVIIPDGTKIGVVPSFDIQTSSFKLQNINASPLMLNNLIAHTKYLKINFSNSFEKAKKDWKTLVALLEEISKNENVLSYFKDENKNYYRFLTFLAENGVVEGLNLILNPKANGFFTVKAGDTSMTKIKGNQHEVWFSGPAAFVNDYVYVELLEKLNVTQ